MSATINVPLTAGEVTALLHATQPDDFPPPTGAAARTYEARLASAAGKLGTARAQLAEARRG